MYVIDSTGTEVQMERGREEGSKLENMGRDILPSRGTQDCKITTVFKRPESLEQSKLIMCHKLTINIFSHINSIFHQLFSVQKTVNKLC